MAKASKGKKSNPEKGKSIIKLIKKSDSDTDDSEHELSYYLDDRVKLMKEVLKIIKPKKIKSMAPEWMRNLEIDEINSMLFEELLGISNKRLKGIFNGQKQEEDSSSTDPEDEQKKGQKPIDVISLDDVTDDDFVINLDSDEGEGSKHKHRHTDKVKVKEESKRKKIKKEKPSKSTKKIKSADKEKSDEDNLMSVLELLELQARARAIRSQLALESKKKAEEKERAATLSSKTKGDNSDNEDAVIIESPKNTEIIITSSESENEESRQGTSKSGDNQSSINTERNGESIAQSREAASQQETQVTSESNKEGDKGNKESNVESNRKNSDDEIIDTTRDKSLDSNTNIETNSQSEECIENSSLDNGSNQIIIEDSEPGPSKVPSKIAIEEFGIFKNRQLSNDSCGEVKNGSQKKEENVNKSGDSNKDDTIERNPDQPNANQPIVIHSDLEMYKARNRIEIKRIRIFRKRRLSNQIESKNENKEIEASSKPEVTTNEILESSESTDKPSETETKGEGTFDKVQTASIDSRRISNSMDENDGILINVDQSEIECITSD